MIDIPIPFAKRYWDLMPINERLRSQDEGTTRNYLRVTLANMYEELNKRMDGPEMVALLKSLPPPAG